MLWNLFSSQRTPKANRKPVRLQVENLEARLAPAVVRWITNADGNWNDCASWRVDGTTPPEFRCPLATDDAVINVAVAATITFTGNHQVRSLSNFERLDMVSGTLALSDVLPTTSSSAVDLIIRNGAALRVLSGVLQINTRATIAGTLEAGANGLVNWGGSFLINAGATFPGTGAHMMRSSTTLTGNVTLPQNLTVENSFVINAGVTATAGQNLTLLGSAFGRIGGDGTLTVPAGSTLNWLAGVMGNSGTTNIQPGATLNLSGPSNRELTGTRVLNNRGTATWTGTGNLSLIPGTAFNNLPGGTFTVQNNSAVVNSGAFNNQGTFTKVGSGGTTLVYAVFTNAGGAVNVQSGTLQLDYGTSTGAFTVAAGATLHFSGAYTLDVGTTFNVSGLIQVGVPQAFRAVVLNANVTAANFHLTSETLRGTGNLTVTGTFTWTNGAMTGTGVTTLVAGATMNISGGNLNRRLDNAGTINWLPDSGRFDLGTQGVLNNQGTFNALGNRPQHFLAGGGGVINNQGTFRRSSTEGTSKVRVDPALNNTGTVQVQSGTLELVHGTSSGTFDVAAGGTLTFAPGTHTMNTGAAFTGDGFSRVAGGTLNVVGDVTALNFGLDSGTLTGPGTLTVFVYLDWTGGTMANTNGVTRLDFAATLAINGNAPKAISGRTLNLDGYTQWYDSGNVSLSTSATINNNGFLDIAHLTDLGMTGSGILNNVGFLLKAGPGRTTFGVTLSNNGGYVGVYEGRLAVTGAYNQNAGYTEVFDGTTLQATVDLRGGYLYGSGTIVGNVTNNGWIEVGGFVDGLSARGILRIQGNYTQTDAGVLSIELGGTTPGTEHDQLEITGLARLDGTLLIQLLDGYVPAAGDFFDVLRWGSRQGEFANMPPGEGVEYGPNGLRLTA